jgi:hypothetical protein
MASHSTWKKLVQVAAGIVTLREQDNQVLYSPVSLVTLRF